MKKIISAIIAIAITCSAIPAYAYTASDYHAYVTELRTLIDECKGLGINTQYEEIDAKIIEVYADRIASFETNGLASGVVNKQLADLTSLYNNAKAKLEAYKDGTKKAPAVVNTYETGDGYSINGASLQNIYGEPYFSAGFGHFSMSGHIPELSSYSFDNVQSVVALGDIVTGDRPLDSWDKNNSGNANVTYEMVSNNGRSNNTSLHVVNSSAKAPNVYGTTFQRVPVKPETKYELSFYVKGTKGDHGTMYSVNDFDNKQWLGYGTDSYSTWTKETYTFTTGENEYFKELRFFYEDICDLYYDDITIHEVGSDKNLVINGGFDGDGNDDFDIFYNEDSSFFEALKALDAGEKNDTHVEVLLQLQQNMPTIITEKYPEVTTGNGRYNIDHAVVQKVEKAYIEGVLAHISNYDSLGSIIVANEPNYNSFLYGYNAKFANYLEQKYGDIDKLNSAYGKSYTSFAKVGIPTAYEASARFYDWKKFNENIFSNWYAKTVNIIKACIPGIPVSLKVQPEFAVTDSESTRKEHMIRGLDLERLGELSDFQGNDSYGYYNKGTIRTTMLWYDYLNSISDKPIYDSEKHITEDEDFTSYSYDSITTFTKQSIWQSMIHGLDMYSIWSWSLDVSDTSSAQYGHLALRPSALADVAKTSLDANRLSAEVTAFANAKPTVAILHDDASRIYNNLYLGSVTLAYKAATEAGHKVGFVTPNNIGTKLSQYSTLVIPYATNVEASVINAIAGFSGKIIMLDSDSLKKNEYNQSYTGDMSTKVNQIKNKATVHEVSGYNYAISGPSVSDVKSSLTPNSEIAVASSDDLEWQAVPYMNGYLVNVSNYNTSNGKTVTITLNGNTPSHITSVIDNADVTTISLPKMTSGLYYVRNVDDELTEEEEVGSNEIIRLRATRSGLTNTLSWKARTIGTYNIYSVTPSGKLRFITTTNSESFTDISDSAKTYVVKCVVEGGESKGKKITCGFDVSSAITVNTTKVPSNKISINYTNNETHCVAATITATSYNDDGTFGSAVVIEVLVPAGKSIDYEKTLVGCGNIVITKK